MTDDTKTLADLKDLVTFKITLGDDGVRICNNAAFLIERLMAMVADVDRECVGLYGYIDSVDNSISESLEKIGEFAGTMGCADRIDVACRLLESIPALRAEIERLKTHKCVHDLAKEFSNSVTGDY